MRKTLLAVCLFLAWPAYAQTAPSQAEIDALKARVEALEKASQCDYACQNERIRQQTTDDLNRELDTLGAINASRPIGEPPIFAPSERLY